MPLCNAFLSIHEGFVVRVLIDRFPGAVISRHELYYEGILARIRNYLQVCFFSSIV